MNNRINYTLLYKQKNRTDNWKQDYSVIASFFFLLQKLHYIIRKLRMEMSVDTKKTYGKYRRLIEGPTGLK